MSLLEYLIPIVTIFFGFIIGAIFKRKTQMLRHKLNVVFLSSKSLSSSQLIKTSSTAMIILYKKNLIKRNKATLQFWERRCEPKFFYEIEDLDQFNYLIQLVNKLKVTHTIVRLSDSKPALLAVGPIGEKRTQKITEGLKQIF